MTIRFRPEDLYPDAEVVTELSRLTNEILRGQSCEEETWLRKTSIPLIQEGYRIDELVFIIRSDRFWHSGAPVRALLPRKEVSPLVLMIRKEWRKWFPYRLPNGQLYTKISREDVSLQ